MEGPRANLDTLPVELLYEIYLYAADEHLPHACARLHAVFHSAPPGVQAAYIRARHALKPHSTTPLLTRALRFPLCTPPVLDALLRHPLPPSPSPARPALPRRLFAALDAPPRGGWRARHAPLPFLQHLYAHPRLPAPPDPDAHKGYALARAARAGHTPLITFLLGAGASPALQEGLSVKLAIQRKDLALVKLLVEPDVGGGRVGKKRRRVPDRVELGVEHLRVAAKAGAEDIVDWMIYEKGCVPDLRTLALMRRPA